MCVFNEKKMTVNRKLDKGAISYYCKNGFGACIMLNFITVSFCKNLHFTEKKTVVYLISLTCFQMYDG